MAKETFGGTLRKLRLVAGFGLRSFADKTGLDAGNLSRMERGQLKPPSDSTVRRLGKALHLDSQTLENLAAMATAERIAFEAGKPLAGYIKRQGPMIPLLLRTVKDKQLTQDEIAQLIEEINNK